MKKYAAVILAAGKGIRIYSDQTPKVMYSLLGLPMIDYVMDNLSDAGIDKKVVVVGYQKEIIKKHLGNKAVFAVQTQQLGTGHALLCAKNQLKDEEAVLVCYGDKPLFRSETIRNLVKTFNIEEPVMAITTAFYDDTFGYGRIKRDESGRVMEIVEEKDCNSEEKNIRECNAGLYIFSAEWLWKNIDQLQTKNAVGELYLTDLVQIAGEQRQKISVVNISDNEESAGINTLEQLHQAEEILESRK